MASESELLPFSIPGLGTTPGEDVGYPTQKTEALLERVIAASTDPEDLVLDCFMGSGTTLAVAQKLGRRWIGCDANYGSVQTARRRMQRIIQGEAEQSGFSLWTKQPQPNQGENEVDVQIRRLEGEPTTIEVIIEGYSSEALSERLRAHRFDGDSNWRAQVDAVEIDPCYDGICYRPTLVDAPQKKRAQVRGRYRLPIPDSADNGEPTTVAVRITDVLGQESLIAEQV